MSDEEKPLTDSVRAQVKRVLERRVDYPSGFYVLLNGPPCPRFIVDSDGVPVLSKTLEEAGFAAFRHQFMGTILQWDGPSQTVTDSYFFDLDENGQWALFPGTDEDETPQE